MTSSHDAAHDTDPRLASRLFRSMSKSAIPPVSSGPGRRDAERDTVVSIVNDPVFQGFHPAHVAKPASPPPDHHFAFQLPAESLPQVRGHRPLAGPPHHQRGTPPPRPPPPLRREPSAIGPSQYSWPHPSMPSMDSYTVAVLGASAVGKSSFIQHSLGLPRPPSSHLCHHRVAVDDLTHSVNLVELDLIYLGLSSSQPIQWPGKIDGHTLPPVDAALVMYSVMSQESVRQLPMVVASLARSPLPIALVACQCDGPQDGWAVDVEAMARHEYFKPCRMFYKISMEKPDSCRDCLQAILRMVATPRRGENSEPGTRRRAQSVANFDFVDSAGSRLLSETSRHTRTSSEFSVLGGYSNTPMRDENRPLRAASPSHGERFGVGNAPGIKGSVLRHEMSHSHAEERSWSRPFHATGKPMFEPGDADAEPRRKAGDTSAALSSSGGKPAEQLHQLPKPEVGFSFDELVDRLLAIPLSKTDCNFSDIFLCLYRKVAAPGDLLSAIFLRLDCVRDIEPVNYLAKTATQLRIVEVVARWASLYPGDFSRPASRRGLEQLVEHLSTEPVFFAAAQNMRRILRCHVIDDDDTGWAKSDESSEAIASELSIGVGGLQLTESGKGRPSNSSEASGAEKGNSVSSHAHSSSYDEYERAAALLEPTDHLPMNKFRYHIFMDISDDDIADELTRIDWIMFSSIRMRDLVRHVNLSAAEKEKCQGLQNVNRMIRHFNYVAKWVANMILLRDKAKHRALMLEKFMSIALKLRQLNNYNGLAAVLAGINGTAIHRLSQTRALVPVEAQKRFARLVILMGTQKSHFAYRLAWENSSLPRIPFVALHRRDLVSAEEGGKTFVGEGGDRINWKKFEVLGDVLLPMMKSQGTPYTNLSRHDTARDLILGCRMATDDEDIYQRSLQVESGSSSQTEASKKKFPWFAKQ